MHDVYTGRRLQALKGTHGAGQDEFPSANIRVLGTVPFVYTDSEDGFCSECVNDGISGEIVEAYSLWEGPSVFCTICGKEMVSYYGAQGVHQPTGSLP